MREMCVEWYLLYLFCPFQFESYALMTHKNFSYV